MSRGQLYRQKGSRIGPRLRAEAAVMVAEGVAKAEVARQLGIARESLRQFGQGDEAELWREWVQIARRRLAARVRHHRIIDELLSTVEIRAEKPDPVATWAAIRNIAIHLAADAHVWNEKHGEALLVTDPDELLILAAAHVGEAAPGPGCEGRGKIFKAIVGACLDLPCRDRDRLAEMKSSGMFVPWKESKGDS